MWPDVGERPSEGSPGPTTRIVVPEGGLRCELPEGLRFSLLDLWNSAREPDAGGEGRLPCERACSSAGKWDDKGETPIEGPDCQSDKGDGSGNRRPSAFCDWARGDLGAAKSLLCWESGITKAFSRPDEVPGREPQGLSLDAGERRDGEGVLFGWWLPGPGEGRWSYIGALSYLRGAPSCALYVGA